MPLWLQVAALVASPIFAAGGAYAAVRVTLEWHEREITRAHARIDTLERDRFLELTREAGV